ncbi:uncharacterized protein LOC126845222 [Adelges cooleyi]|uniref:uncharacterized protein LOC126845222 n=1 Tax=Adelges cooleyi TaxID=133065 RepID=UPI00217F982A|nr:uncharacterized protein LOC126845222 [Adelges cooleyi]XP_050439776.1 uncharacterized protein LOC126845222 [Adelges cooleyi]XP_050439777.1 uncharacterized protein LOC126845222 [Adelges cooleyi]
MKRLYVIILSLTLVNVLLAALDDYDKEVIRTNKHIELAGDQLRTVIRNAIYYKNYSMEEINFMLAVPDFADYNRTLSLWCQIHLQALIRYTTGIKGPDINEADFEDVDLSVYGNARRDIAREATKTLIQAEISERDPNTLNFPLLCRLIGLWRSIHCPDLCITHAVDDNETCTLNAKNNIITLIYRSFDGTIWEMNENNYLIQPLADQLG